MFVVLLQDKRQCAAELTDSQSFIQEKEDELERVNTVLQRMKKELVQLRNDAEKADEEISGHIKDKSRLEVWEMIEIHAFLCGIYGCVRVCYDLKWRSSP